MMIMSIIAVFVGISSLRVYGKAFYDIPVGASCSSCAAEKNLEELSSLIVHEVKLTSDDKRKNYSCVKNAPLILKEKNFLRHPGENPTTIKIVDKGIQGNLFKIDEENLILVIHRKLDKWKKSGDIQTIQTEIQERTLNSLQNPISVQGLKKAQRYAKRYYDPTFEVKDTIKDHNGTIIHKKGTLINPLHRTDFGDPLLFVDGTDKSQLQWVKQESGKIVLVKGRPLDLVAELGREVYFDQGGALTKRLDIHDVPTKVAQEGDQLKIESFALEREGA